ARPSCWPTTPRSPIISFCGRCGRSGADGGETPPPPEVGFSGSQKQMQLLPGPVQAPLFGPPQKLLHEVFVQKTAETFAGRPSRATRPIVSAKVKANFRIFIGPHLSCRRNRSGGRKRAPGIG